MSSNIIKAQSVILHNPTMRVIDSNDFVAQRIEHINSSYMNANDIHKLEYNDLNRDNISKLLSDGEEVKDELIPLTDTALSGSIEEDYINNESNEDNEINGMSVIEAGKRTAEELIREAQDRITEMEANVLETLDSRVDIALAEARVEGYNEGIARADAENDIIRAQLARKERELNESYDKKIAALESLFVDNLTSIYEHIFNAKLDEFKDVIIHLLRTTIKKAEGANDFIVRVSMEDYPHVSANKDLIRPDGVSKNTKIEIIEDSSIEKGEALIETAGGVFDCGIGTQLDELNKKMRILAYEKG